MKHTKAQRALIAAAFQKALPYIWACDTDYWSVNNRYAFICHAVRHANPWEGAKLAIKVIESRLGRRIDRRQLRTVHDWLLEVAKIDENKLTDSAVQQYRIQWVKSLIAEFSK